MDCLNLLQVTEAQQQWWSFKSDNFDSVLLFKVGKFYEVRMVIRRITVVL